MSEKIRNAWGAGVGSYMRDKILDSVAQQVLRPEHHPVSGIRQALIDAVREHDTAAADWMETKAAGDLAGAEVSEAIDLCGLFCWDDTPQGYDYWNALDDKVGTVIDRRNGGES